MDGAIRDALMKFGGPIPVIGVPLAIAVFLGWLTYQAHESHSEATGALGAATAGLLLAVAIFVPSAKSACADLYQSSNLAFQKSNCQILVSCQNTWGKKQCS